ncbi:pyrroline-5-carboxylate reductase [Domibacillus sp. 8LH]|uniref:pyrroline-5-carboxylate reductase n=1 Tax=Domibacillus sp. 8LH TaxID=3073900 RepID=UPI00317A3220
MGKQTIVAFLGAGSMAEAMIAGIVQNGQWAPEHVIVTNHSNHEKRAALQAKYGIRAMQSGDLPFDQIDFFILAMKPKDADTALQSLKGSVRPHQVIVSVMAGLTTAFIEAFFPEGQQVIRAMPNTSAIAGESATAICAGRWVKEKNINIAIALLSSIGKVYSIEEEKMDLFTGIAGSGPAYFYFLLEQMERAGRESGMDIQMVREIGAQTLLGAAKMIMRQENTPAELRENITSPNGTTYAGLAALESFGGGEAIYEAVKGAAKRSKEISEQFSHTATHV